METEASAFVVGSRIVVQHPATAAHTTIVCIIMDPQSSYTATNNKHTSSIMSQQELAPLVAAVLEESVVNDLLEKIAAFQEIQIVGTEPRTGLTDVYATGKLDQGVYNADLNSWAVPVERYAINDCPLERIGQLQIRIGGMMHGQISPETRCQNNNRRGRFIFGDFRGYHNDDNVYGSFSLNNRNEIVRKVFFRVGPFTSLEQYQTTPAEHQDDFPCSALVQLGNGQQGMKAFWDYIYLDFDQIEGVLDNILRIPRPLPQGPTPPPPERYYIMWP